MEEEKKEIKNPARYFICTKQDLPQNADKNGQLRAFLQSILDTAPFISGISGQW